MHVSILTTYFLCAHLFSCGLKTAIMLFSYFDLFYSTGKRHQNENKTKNMMSAELSDVSALPNLKFCNFFISILKLDKVQYNTLSVILNENLNFRQSTAIWIQPMRTYNLTQAQDPESYARWIQLRISLSSKLRTLGKGSTLMWMAGAVLLCRALFCFVWNLFFFPIIVTSN